MSHCELYVVIDETRVNIGHRRRMAVPPTGSSVVKQYVLCSQSVVIAF